MRQFDFCGSAAVTLILVFEQFVVRLAERIQFE